MKWTLFCIAAGGGNVSKGALVWLILMSATELETGAAVGLRNS